MPAREGTLRTSTAVSGVASHLRADVLALDARLVVKGENDRADHRGEQNHPRRLKEVEIAGVEHLAERGRVAEHALRSRGGGGPLRGAETRDDVDELDRHQQRDQQPLRQVLDEALLQPGEIHVEQHDDEQKQHRHRADIDDDQDHRQELRAHQQEQAGRADEGKNEEEDRMHRVPGDDDGESRRHQNRRKNPEEQSIGLHRPPLVISPLPGRPSPRGDGLRRPVGASAPLDLRLAARPLVRPRP